MQLSIQTSYSKKQFNALNYTDQREFEQLCHNKRAEIIQLLKEIYSVGNFSRYRYVCEIVISKTNINREVTELQSWRIENLYSNTRFSLRPFGTIIDMCNNYGCTYEMVEFLHELPFFIRSNKGLTKIIDHLTDSNYVYFIHYHIRKVTK